jgi:hypothetical protein
MSQPYQIKPEDKLAPPGDSWRAAEAAGVDMSLLEHSLSLTVWERMVEHQRTLEILEMLENAKIKQEPDKR